MRWNPIAERYEGDKRWVIMRRLPDERKIPLSPVSNDVFFGFGNLKVASVSDRNTWGLLGDALGRIPKHMIEEKLAMPALSLIGDLMIVDFDKVLNNGRVLSLDAVMLSNEYPTYVEVSMSGRGLHFYYLLSSNWEPPQKRFGHASVEVYTQKRFVAVTGLSCDVSGGSVMMKDASKCRVATLTPDDAMNVLTMFGYNPEKRRVCNGARAPLTKSDEDVIQEAVRRNSKFASLLSGNWQGLYPSQSEADCAFCGILARITNDREQIERIWMNSGLYREKLNRVDYRERTLNAVDAGNAARAGQYADAVEFKLAEAKRLLRKRGALPASEGGLMALADEAFRNMIPYRVLMLAIDHEYGEDEATRLADKIESRYAMNRTMLLRKK